ncbi:glycine oxidase ThiO [Halomicronema hongdechloris]
MTERTSDVLVIGGGIIGLAIALELKQRGARVRVLSREVSQAASQAAAGMLAPHAEVMGSEAMYTLCRRSLSLYPDWVSKLEGLTGQAVGYWPCGILMTQYRRPDADAIASASTKPVRWLEAETLAQYQPGLSDKLTGAWWLPEDAQVDSRAVMQALRGAVQDQGIDILEGVEVEGLVRHQGAIQSVRSRSGDFQADHYVLATGAWAHQLLPLPVFPRKGQMLSLRVPHGHPQAQPLQHVIYGHNLYLVPRRDRRIIIGATSESVGFTPGNTPSGLNDLLSRAMELCPALADFPLDECWWGFRPATPDNQPILGASACSNLTLATGHYRNGILLAPITAQLVAQAILEQQPDPLLAAFSWQRFHQPSPSSTTAISPQPMQILDAHPQAASTGLRDTPLTIAGRPFNSRLMTGTGKYENFDVMGQSIAASGCEIVTVAVRRVQAQAPGHQGLAEAIDWSKIWMLPNTAGCRDVDEAVRVARLGREMAKLLGQEDNNFVKLEVIPDPQYLLPDPIGTLRAAEKLIKEGFAVLPYINADPLLAKRLEEAGCVTVMPLGSPIGSGQGIRTLANLEIIIETAGVPVVVDAGIGIPSEAAQAMEAGADALLINTAIAKAKNPIAMARAMAMATTAGRLAYLAGRIPIQSHASASSPLAGRITS